MTKMNNAFASSMLAMSQNKRSSNNSDPKPNKGQNLKLAEVVSRKTVDDISDSEFDAIIKEAQEENVKLAPAGTPTTPPSSMPRGIVGAVAAMPSWIYGKVMGEARTSQSTMTPDAQAFAAIQAMAQLTPLSADDHQTDIKKPVNAKVAWLPTVNKPKRNKAMFQAHLLAKEQLEMNIMENSKDSKTKYNNKEKDNKAKLDDAEEQRSSSSGKSQHPNRLRLL